MITEPLGSSVVVTQEAVHTSLVYLGAFLAFKYFGMIAGVLLAIFIFKVVQDLPLLQSSLQVTSFDFSGVIIM